MCVSLKGPMEGFRFVYFCFLLKR
uniref:Uncharacterized protein n=1 Tax=Anguilla anguilla TaxID=7936 RepID=A0A0E9SGJ1_ANGAN